MHRTLQIGPVPAPQYRFPTILRPPSHTGVIWKGDSIIPGVPETLDMLKSMGKRLIFVTNNSTKSRAGYLKKFHSLGLTQVTAVSDLRNRMRATLESCEALGTSSFDENGTLSFHTHTLTHALRPPHAHLSSDGGGGDADWRRRRRVNWCVFACAFFGVSHSPVRAHRIASSPGGDFLVVVRCRRLPRVYQVQGDGQEGEPLAPYPHTAHVHALAPPPPTLSPCAVHARAFAQGWRTRRRMRSLWVE
jgi:hypothetical protein